MEINDEGNLGSLDNDESKLSNRMPHVQELVLETLKTQAINNALRKNVLKIDDQPAQQVVLPYQNQ